MNNEKQIETVNEELSGSPLFDRFSQVAAELQRDFTSALSTNTSVIVSSFSALEKGIDSLATAISSLSGLVKSPLFGAFQAVRPHVSAPPCSPIKVTQKTLKSLKNRSDELAFIDEPLDRAFVSSSFEEKIREHLVDDSGVDVESLPYDSADVDSPTSDARFLDRIDHIEENFNSRTATALATARASAPPTLTVTSSDSSSSGHSDSSDSSESE